MHKKSRHDTLKVQALGASAVWAKPIADSVVLPTHGIHCGGIEGLRSETQAPARGFPMQVQMM